MTDRSRRSKGSLGWRLLGLAEAPLVAAVLVGMAAAYLPPWSMWWPQLIAIGLPYLIWPLGAMTVIWLLGRQWPMAVLHVLLVLVMVLRVGGPGRLSAGTAGPDDLVLTTFNVPQTGPSAEALADSVVGYVEGSAPDILLMQDARVISGARPAQQSRESPQVEAIRTRLDYEIHVPQTPRNRPRGWQGNTTDVPFFALDGAGVEVIDQDVLLLGDGRDPEVSLALRTHLAWDGREAVVYNIHLRSFGTPKPWQDDAFQLTSPSTWRPYRTRYRGVYAERGREARAIAERIAGETLPVIVAGDFNSTADNWSFRQLRTAGGVGRVDAMRAAGGEWGRTYHSADPVVRIDFVLVDPAFEVTSAASTRVGFSDHRPVRVTLRWRD